MPSPIIPSRYADFRALKLSPLHPPASRFESDVRAAIDSAEPGSMRKLREILRQRTVAFYKSHAHLSEAHKIDAICELVDAKIQVFRKALDDTTLSRNVIEAIVSFVDFRLDTQAAIYELEMAHLLQALKGHDTAETGTAEELASAMKVSAETVRRRTVDRTLIAVLAPGRKRGREYPMFQAWPGIAGKPQQQVLDALGRPEGPEAYQFMTTPSDFLGGLTPIEVLVGDAPATADLAPGAREFLQEDDEARLRAVVDVAAQCAAAREGA